MGEAVEVLDVVKAYRDVVALSGLTLTARQGEIVGIAGPNGAGKTTLVKILLGVARRDSGEVRVFGRDPSDEGATIRRSISIVHQRGGMDMFLTAWDNFRTYLRLRGLDVGRGLARALVLSDRFQVRELLHRPLVTLSGGESRKLQLVRALLPESPRLLIMDEPTVGVDPPSRRVLWETVRGVVSAGTTALWTTHDLHEMESVSDRVAVVRKGQCVALGTPGELSDLLFGRVVEVRGVIVERSRDLLQHVPRARLLSATPTSAVLALDSDQTAVPAIAQMLVESGSKIDSLNRRPFNLEEVFLKLTQAGEVS